MVQRLAPYTILSRSIEARAGGLQRGTANLPQHTVLFSPLGPTAYVYFPATAIVSLTSKLADGH
jgi:hypothetical protein